MPCIFRCSLLAAVSFAERVKLIVDTDMSTDVDDVLALALALRLDALGQAQLLAVVHNTGFLNGVGAISVINHYYGRDDIPIGAYKGAFGDPRRWGDLDDSGKTTAGPYAERLVENYTEAPIRNYTQVPEATEVYRKVLAAQEDSSVSIASIGFLTNLEALLRSQADVHSELTGANLVALKVKQLVVMGGGYPSSHMAGLGGYEWNFAGGCRFGTPNGCPVSPQATSYVLENWPENVAVVFSGFEVGEHVLTGKFLADGDVVKCPAAAGPVGQAFADFASWNELYPFRQSWDPVTTLFAVRGVQNFYELHRTGHNTLNVSDGSNTWVEQPRGKQAYVKLKLAEVDRIAGLIDELICESPGPKIESQVPEAEM